MLPTAAPVWLAGLWFLFFRRDGQPFRALGWAFLVAAALILALNPRVHYLFPAFPMLFAAGAVMWESWLDRPRPQWIKRAYVALLILTGTVIDWHGDRGGGGSGAAGRHLHSVRGGPASSTAEH